MNENLIPLISYLAQIEGFSKGSGEILEQLFKGHEEELSPIFRYESTIKAFLEISKKAKICLDIIHKELGRDEIS